MAIRDLIPWAKSPELASSRSGYDPFVTLHRQVNRLFDDVSRSFAVTGVTQPMHARLGWPKSNSATPTRC